MGVMYLNDLTKDVEEGEHYESNIVANTDGNAEEEVLQQIETNKRELYLQKMTIHQNYNKKLGILPNDFTKFHVKTSFVLANKIPDLNDMRVEETLDLSNVHKKIFRINMDDIIITQTNKCYMQWQFLNTFCCLTSSYLYAYLAAFENSNDIASLQHVNWAYEGVFLISLIMNFFVEYNEDGQQFPIRDIQKIAINYIRNQFIMDFIPIIPLQEIRSPSIGSYRRLFFLIKIMRLYKGFKIFNIPAIMKKVKILFKRRSDELVLKDKNLAENTDVDSNGIKALIIIGFIFKIMKLVITLFNMSYFIGFGWYIVSELQHDIVLYNIREYKTECISLIEGQIVKFTAMKVKLDKETLQN